MRSLIERACLEIRRECHRCNGEDGEGEEAHVGIVLFVKEFVGL